MSLYRVLGLDPAASKDEVRGAFKRQALVAHPDKGGSKEAFHAVTRAFQTLHDDAARAVYDRRLSGSGRAAAPAAGPPGPPAARPTAGRPAAGRPAADSSPQPPPSGAGSSSVGPAAGAGGSAATGPARSAAAAPADGPRAGQLSGGPQEGAARAPSGHAPPSEPASAGAQGPRHSYPMQHLGLEGVLEHLKDLLRRLSSETRRRVLETRLTQLQRRALEQWMVSQQATKTSPVAQDAKSTSADSVLVEADAGPSSSFGSDASDSSEAECARLALEDLPRDAEEEDCNGARLPGEAKVGVDGSDQEGDEAFDDYTKLPCLHRVKLRGGGYAYGLQMQIHGLMFTTKIARDLATAIDFHVVFMAVRELAPPVEALDASSIESMFAEVSDEQGLHVERDMGIKVSIRIKASILTEKQLAMPSLPFSRIQDVMSIWEQTFKRFKLCGLTQACRGLTQAFLRINPFRTYEPDTLREMWLALRRGYVRCHVLNGKAESDVIEWLDAQYAERGPFRERLLENWNLFRMKSEDRMKRPRQSASMHKFYGSRRERQAMAAEDKGAERTRSLNHDWCLLEQVELCLQRWLRLDAVGAKRQRREEAASAKRQRREVLLERAAQRAQREQWRQRRARWRPDMTMREMMQGPAGASQ